MADLTPGKSDFERLRSECKATPEVLLELKSRFGNLTELTIIRHLIVCDGDLERTNAHIVECQLWRQTMFPMAACPYSQTTGDCVLYLHGHDIEGHPLYIYTPRLNDPKKRNLDELVRWFLYMAEIGLQRMPADKAQVTVLINRLNMNYVTDFEFVKRVGYHCRHHYPARVFKVLFYPVSRVLQAAWGVMKSVVSKRFADSLRMKHDLAALRNAVPDEFIPAELGGSCNYRFSMDDYPSPFTENYRPAEALLDEESPPTEFNMDDLYYPDTGDDVDGLALTQASVGANFSYQARPLLAPAPAKGPTIKPPSTPAPIVLRSTAVPVAESDHSALRAECRASAETIAALQSRFPHLTVTTLVRHLLVNDHTLEKAAASIDAWQLWRQMVFPMTAVPYSQTNQESLLYCHGTDHFGRPLLIYTPRLNDPKTRNLEELMRWTIYMIEIALQRLPPDRAQVVALINRIGFNSRQQTDFEMFRRLNELLVRYYPCRVHKLLVYPVSPALMTTWRLAHSFIHERSVHHVHMINSMDNLRQFVPDKFIPADMGGLCTYRFNMKDYPSPFAETIHTDSASAAGPAATGEVGEIDVDDLYYPDTGDDVDGTALMQASVASQFSYRSKPAPCSRSSSKGESAAVVPR